VALRRQMIAVLTELHVVSGNDPTGR
jgi:hypothetical protein